MSENIELDLKPEEYQQVLEIYMQNKFSKESLEVYKESEGTYQVAAFAALMNEALIDAVIESLKEFKNE